jgi:DNA-binding XRE family transcriptional regulator
MTPQELREWRRALHWSQRRAAEALGVSWRAYRYLEEGATSHGVRRPTVPRHIELATAELSRMALEQA